MSEIEKLNQKLQLTELAYQSALEINQFKAGYLGKIAHELRSPLSSIMSLQQLIINDLCDNPEEEREFVMKTYEYAKKLMTLIDQIVEISKIESGKIPLEIESLQLKTIFQEIYNRTYLQVANKNFKLEIEDIKPNIYVKADQKSLIQCFVNLIDGIITNIDTGIIIIKVTSLSEKSVTISIDNPTPLHIWNESTTLPDINLAELKKTSPSSEFSCSMKLMLSKTILEIMGGNLEILELPLNNKSDSLTSLQCLLPSSLSRVSLSRETE